MNSTSPEVVALIVLTAAAAFFAASEAAIVSVSRIKIRALAEKHVKNADRVTKLLEDRNRTLTSILIGNTFVLLAADSVRHLSVHFGRRPARRDLVDGRDDGDHLGLRRDHPQDGGGRQQR